MRHYPNRRTHRVERLEYRLTLSASTAADAPHLLFIRGGDRTGGFLEAGSDAQRTEQLADLFNTSTSGGNHGWAELRLTLENAGFDITQMKEGSETRSGPADGIALDLAAINLAEYDAIVFGSNNAVYSTESVDAVEAYVRGGGSTLFISDANFGGDWADASNSDQQFLDRFGLIMHQDQGTYSLQRSQGDFALPNHPILTGVDRFDGEGVTPIELGTLADGVDADVVVGAKGTTRLNEPPFGGQNRGPSRSSDPAIDGSLLVASADEGKVVGHFDRNTFFNQNGAGTNINRFDNEQYALNLFGYLVGAFDPLPGDYDNSGVVDQADYTVWVDQFGRTSRITADGNGDGRVDAADYTIWRDHLGCERPVLDLTADAASAAFPLFTPTNATAVDQSPTIAERDSVYADLGEESLRLIRFGSIGALKAEGPSESMPVREVASTAESTEESMDLDESFAVGVYSSFGWEAGQKIMG